jgi:hypothetical protein
MGNVKRGLIHAGWMGDGKLKKEAMKVNYSENIKPFVINKYSKCHGKLISVKIV